MKSLAIRYWQGLSPALRRYHRASLWPSLVFFALLYAHEWAAGQARLSIPVRAAFALAPVVALAWTFGAYLRFLRECDELERRIELDALAWAAGVALLGAMACVLLLDARVVAWSALHVAAAFGLLLVGSYVLVRALLHRRYR